MKTYLEDGLVSGAAAADSRKKVLLIGDSIRRGYCGTVKSSLEDIADVRFPNDNCRFTQFVYVSLESWRWLFPEPETVDVVWWNCGHWDVAHWDGAADSLNSPEIYAEMIKRISVRMRKYFPNAKIVFASTTPTNPDGSVGKNPRSREEIKRYNETAKRVLAELSSGEGFDFRYEDLYAFTENWGSEMYHDYCHYTENGFNSLGAEVAERIRGMLV